MLTIYTRLSQISFRELMEVYREGNEENARDLYPELPENQGILQVEADFYHFLRENFFRRPQAAYAVWEEAGRYRAALRLWPFSDGLLVEALETAPEQRNRGYGKALLSVAARWAGERGWKKLYSHVNKDNIPSLAVHRACGFRIYKDSATYTDGTVRTNCYTLCKPLDDSNASISPELR